MDDLELIELLFLEDDQLLGQNFQKEEMNSTPICRFKLSVIMTKAA